MSYLPLISHLPYWVFDVVKVVASSLPTLGCRVVDRDYLVCMAAWKYVHFGIHLFDNKVLFQHSAA